MDAQLKSRGFAEGLLGIEELNSYDMVKKNSKLVTVVKDAKISKGKKRPLVSSDNIEKEPKKKKKQKKKPKKDKVIAIEEEEETETEKADDPENDDESDVEDATENAEKEPKKKKRTRQKRKPKKPKVSVTEEEEDGEKVDDHENDEEADDFEVDLPAWKEFNVPKVVLKALTKLNFTEPTPIQRDTLPAAINGHTDILGAAETGSGKTLAFAIPIIHGILADREKVEESEAEPSSEEEEDLDDPEAENGCVRVVNDVDFDFEVDIDQEINVENPFKSKGKLRALVLTPTRELAIQVKNHIEAITKFTDIRTVPIVGGMAPQKQIRLLDHGPEIVVATPGRLWDLIQEGHPHLAQVRDIAYLAIDESDRMVEKGHFEELQKLLEMINSDEKKKKRRQNFVFSATLSLVHELPKHLSHKKGAKKMTSQDKLKHLMDMIGVKARPKIVDLTRKIGTAETLTESKIHCTNTEKDYYLYYFLQQHPGRTIVFCNSIDCVRRLVNLFSLLWTEPLGLHAQMHQKQRLKNLERFSAAENGFLIATDVAARGLDIPDVEHVVHYQVPRTSESYVHRSGRTARAKKEGVSVVLIDPSETQFYKRMCVTLNRDEDLAQFPVDLATLSAVKLRINTARTLDKLLLDQRKEDAEKNWLKKAAEEADLEISDDDGDHEKAEAKAKIGVKIKQTKAQLNTLLATPLHTHNFGGKYPTMSGRLQFPTEFKGQEKSAVSAVSKSQAELTALLKRPSQKQGRKKKFGKKKK